MAPTSVANAATVVTDAQPPTPSLSWASSIVDSEIFCTRFSFDDAYVAASYANGLIKVFDAKSGREEFKLRSHGVSEDKKENMGDPDVVGLKALEYPTTQLRWRPNSAQSKTKNVLISVNAASDGLIQHWHVKSGKCLHTIKEKGNPIFCIDYSTDGSTFVTAGRDRILRVYDEATKKLKCHLTEGDRNRTAGHSNRVFSLKVVDSNTMMSGGWDNTVQIWDARKGYSVRSIFGCYICGDSVDVKNDGTQILTGSYRAEDPLQLWDVSTGKLIDTIPWKPAGHFSGSTAMLYAAQFSKDENNSLIAAGGTQENETKIFQTSGEILGAFQTPRPVFSVDFSYDNERLAIGSADGVLRLINVRPSTRPPTRQL